MNTEWKYAPKSLDEYIFGTDEVKDTVMQYVEGGARRPLILHGFFGTGKSLLARLIPKAIDGSAVMVDRINGSDLVNKTQQLEFLDRPERFDHLFEPADQSRWYTIVEEMSVDVKAKEAMRVLMDKMSQRTQFIFTTNELHKIDGAIQSRSEVLRIDPLTAEQFLPRAEHILEAEGVRIPRDLLGQILEDVYVNYRDNREYYKTLDRLIFKAKQRNKAAVDVAY